MNRFLFVLFALLPSIVLAQRPVFYSEVIEVDATQDELFKRARRWFSETFVDSKSVLNIQDKESGELVGKATMKFTSYTKWGSDGTKGLIVFKVAIFTRNGKYKYEITDFVHEGNPYNTINLSFGLITDETSCPKHLPRQKKKWEDKLWFELQSHIQNQMESLIPSLEAAMQKSTDF